MSRPGLELGVHMSAFLFFFFIYIYIYIYKFPDTARSFKEANFTATRFLASPISFKEKT